MGVVNQRMVLMEEDQGDAACDGDQRLDPQQDDEDRYPYWSPCLRRRHRNRRASGRDEMIIGRRAVSTLPFRSCEGSSWTTETRPRCQRSHCHDSRGSGLTQRVCRESGPTWRLGLGRVRGQLRISTRLIAPDPLKDAVPYA